MKAYDIWKLRTLQARNDPRILINGQWVPARPDPYYSFFNRLKLAWMVLRYKADVFVWPEQENTNDK